MRKSYSGKLKAKVAIDMGAALMEQVKSTVNKGVQHYQYRICTTF